MAWTERYLTTAAAGGGDGTTEGTAWTLAEAITNEAAGMLINVKAGTYSRTTAGVTLAATGTTTSPVVWRGYATTPGDMDGEHSLTLPAITFTTGQFVISGTYHILMNLDISGQCVTSGGQVKGDATGSVFHGCKIANTAANANALALKLTNGANVLISGCQLSATQTAAAAFQSDVTGIWVVGTSIRGGVAGVIVVGSSHLIRCVIDDPGSGAGIQVAGNLSSVIDCSVYGAGTDAVRVTSATSAVLVVNLVSQSSGGYAVNESSGTSSTLVRVIGNAYRTASSGELNGIVESLQYAGNGALASDPFAAAASHDFTLNTVAKGLGFPGAFLGESYTGHGDVGAVQSASAGGGALFGPLGNFIIRGVS